MKNRRLSALVMAVCLLVGSCACGTACGGNNALGSSVNSADLSPAEISELAMDNFVKKLQAGNYVVGNPANVVTNAVSPEQVYFVYPHEGYPTIYAYMTAKGETFAALIENDEMGDIEFISADTAINSVEGLVPNNWISITDGNLFELFYNNVEKPLEFTSNDENVKYTLGCLGGYGQMALEVMEEVHMEFDSEDPTTVHFTAAVPDVGTYYFDDLDLTLKFGEAEAEPHIEAWLKAPEYPKVRTAWTSNDVSDMDLVFMRGYGKDTVPFPGFASYALTFDPKAYDQFLGIRITDAHATEKNVEEYKSLLLSSGYEEVQETQDDGSTVAVYRKLLRENYRAYAELYPHYDNGFVMEGMMYYEDPSYDGLAAISSVMEQHGFAALAETDLFEGWSATDQSASRNEGFAYFFNYDLYMPFILSFSDDQAAKTYWDDYGKKLLELGFTETFVAGENVRDLRSSDGSKIFRTTFNEGSVILEVKSEKVLSAEEVNRMAAEYGIPSADLSGNVGGRDQAGYRYETTGFTGLFITATQQYGSSAEAEAFLDAYAAKLQEAGFEMTDPQKAASARMFLFLNLEQAKYVGFDYFPGDDGASVLFEFFASDAEGESMMTNALKRSK
ncbi:MAG: hypothetical protein J5865_04260 [Lachnospiraceae bacterium]|nr:hypothetical protein [Lachnospiraceae bacterium]